LLTSSLTLGEMAFWSRTSTSMMAVGRRNHGNVAVVGWPTGIKGVYGVCVCVCVCVCVEGGEVSKKQPLPLKQNASWRAITTHR
jgi:hypothetical protein